jgi:peptidoglycan/xylan/chitin deacetylase (PgdA/CDA1 family)
MKNGALCISLDFEKYWGMHDIVDINESTVLFNNVQEVVNKMLDLFRKYDVHCTWATVGLLNFNSLEELLIASNDLEVNYEKKDYSPYPISKHYLNSEWTSQYLGQAEINRIKAEEGQELASHTFSHYYCMEKGQTTDNFIKDISLFKKYIGPVNSIVFPRNQVNKKYLSACFEGGIKTYRGNQQQWFWKNNTYDGETNFQKIIRTADAYLMLSKTHFTSWPEVNKPIDQLINIPANRFLKPFKYGKLIEQLKLRRIKKEMLRAAKTKSIYHLWWHPHNFSAHIDENFKQLEVLLKYYTNLHMEYGFQSLNMNEITSTIE